MAKPYRIMLVAGEPSGDTLAAKLVAELRDGAPDWRFEFFGSVGPRMRDAGVEAAVSADDLAIMGPVEIARAMPMFLRTYRRLKALARSRRPDAAVLVDFPEFNLNLAKFLKKRGIPVIYYVSPQLWGWRKYRRRTIRDNVDLLLAILPFEEAWYAQYGISNVEYVGNPLVQDVRPSISREEFRAKHSVDAAARLIALLPGSRHKEIVRILPPMLQAAAMLRRHEPDLRFAVALASGRNDQEVVDAKHAAESQGLKVPNDLIVVRNETYDVLNASDAAAVASGTATLEAGIIGTPMAVVYKTSRINYRLIRPLIAIDNFGLINLIAGRRIAAELIQDEFTPDSLVLELIRLLEPETNRALRAELRDAANALGEEGASKRAAAAILRILERTDRPTDQENHPDNPSAAKG